MSLDLGPCKKSKKSKFLKRILDYSGHHGPSLAKFWLKNGGPFRAKASGRAEISESSTLFQAASSGLFDHLQKGSNLA